MKLLGCVMARNEWPLLGISVIHHLLLGFDHIAVIVHDSNDSTSSGLQLIHEKWPDKLSTYHLPSSDFFQEATIAAIISLIPGSDFDWVYVFDADEFILLRPGLSVREILHEADDCVDALRYEIIQWSVPCEMNDLDLNAYASILDRTVPGFAIPLPDELKANEIASGNLNYFDFPFPSKVIVRGRLAHFLTAGAHSLRSTDGIVFHQLDPVAFRVGHLPLTSKRRLQLKSDQGASLVRMGYPLGHGWQNQLIARLQCEGRLDDYWKSISSGSPDGDSKFAKAKTVADGSLSDALLLPVDALRQLLAKSPQLLQQQLPAEASEDKVSLSAMVASVNLIIQENRQAMTRVAGWRAEANQAKAEATQAKAEAHQAKAEANRLRTQLLAAATSLQRSADKLSWNRNKVSELEANLVSSRLIIHGLKAILPKVLRLLSR